MKFKVFIFLMVMCCFTACVEEDDKFDVKFYNKVTGLPLPSKYTVLESEDSGEWITVTTFKVDSSTLTKYIADNKFKQLSAVHPTLMSRYYLKGLAPGNNDWKDQYYVAGDKGRNHWLYLIDIKRNLMWAEITYPDWAAAN